MFWTENLTKFYQNKNRIDLIKNFETQKKSKPSSFTEIKSLKIYCHNTMIKKIKYLLGNETR